MPRVSIGLPVFNGQNYVGDAIRSVCGQTYQNWELIISDNGSSDATEQICQQFSRHDSRIHYVRAEQNRGAAWNFNRVFELSSGKYFRWLSHDDVLAETLVARCIDVLERMPQVILCSTTTGAIDEQRRRILDAGEAHSDLTFQGLNAAQEQRRIALSADPRADRRFQGILLDSLRCYEIYGLIRRHVMADTQLHPAYCGGEKVLLAELALMGPFHEIPEPLFFCRWHSERFTANDSTAEQNEHMAPGSAPRYALPHQYRATLGYLQLIGHKQLTLAERWACLQVWLRFILQVQKWGRILKNTLTGTAAAARVESPTCRGPVVDIPSVSPLMLHL